MPVSKTAPERGVRVLSKTIWTILHRQWEDHKRKGTPPPQLAPPSARRLYFTDGESVQVCSQATDFGLRLSLWPPDLFQIQVGGCAIVYFDRADLPAEPEIPDPNLGGTTPPGFPLPPGLTAGGAREWVLNNNVALTNTMEVFVVESSGARWGPLSL